MTVETTPLLGPIARALIPVDSEAAGKVSAPNYDEYLDDMEVFREIQRRPSCVLTVTMAHCAVRTPDEILEQDSPEALQQAGEGFRALARSPLLRRVEGVFVLYEIVDPERPGVRQIGLGGMAPTSEIRTEGQEVGRIVRNEGIREEKARGRARLVEATRSIIGTVNLAVEDRTGRFASVLEGVADRRLPDLKAIDERGCTHRIWILPAGGVDAGEAVEALEREPEAYVADGNHRSAAAAMLGLEGFPAVVFPAGRMGLAPYNRLVAVAPLPRVRLVEKLEGFFQVEPLADIPEGFRPQAVNQIGLLDREGWLRLTPAPEHLASLGPADSIDAAIVQRRVFQEIFEIRDPRDARLTFVGGNRDAAWLEEQVRSGAFGYAVSLAPVTMEQFLDVCRAGEFMPPKSTWFQPKLRMGLFMVELA
ncbi:MAG: DUF1015 family protein [Gemmatimonadales bacterium]|nr:MAG: DUF1015 family protein [Gemmatimonadales bacterium]